MRRNLLFVFLAFALVLPSFAAFADTFTFPKSKVQFDVPAGWQTERGDGEVTLTSADKSVVVVVTELEVANFKLAEKALREGLAEAGVKGITFSNDVVENGLKGKNYSGTAVIEGQKMNSGMSLYQTPVAGRYMMVFGIFISKPSAKVAKELEAMQFKAMP